MKIHKLLYKQENIIYIYNYICIYIKSKKYFSLIEPGKNIYKKSKNLYNNKSLIKLLYILILLN